MRIPKTSTIVAASFAIFLVLVIWFLPYDSGSRNLHVYQAEAFLHGRLNVSEKLEDVSIYNGKYYDPFPPVPAVLLVPLVAVFGIAGTKVTLVATLLTVLNAFILSRLLKRLGINNESTLWLIVALFMGTGYWFAVVWSSGVWFFAHVVAVSFMLLAIHEAMGSGRGIITGMLLGCAFLSRQLSIYSSVFILSALLMNPSNASSRSRLRNVFSFVLSLTLCVGVYLVFNWARFGNPFDTGYSYLDLHGFYKARVEHYGLFGLKYLPFNFIYMFFQGPHVEFTNGLRPTGMDPFGTSLIFASPFVLFAFLAKGKKALIISAWITIGLTVFHMLLYNNNGVFQSNTQRFTLDFLPVLIVLVALSLPHVNTRLFRISIAYSVFLNIVSMVFLPTGRGGPIIEHLIPAFAKLVHISSKLPTNAQWLNQTSGTTSDLYKVCFTDANTGTAVGENGTILRTTNGGTTWRGQSSGTTSDLLAVSFTDANTGTVVGIGGTILRTTDGGATWVNQESRTTHAICGVSFTDANTGTVVGANGTILRTTDGGTTWRGQSSGTPTDLFAVCFTDANTGTVTGINGTILRTTDGGAAWIYQESGTTRTLYGVSFTDANTGTVVGENGIILGTTNGGVKWNVRSTFGTTTILWDVSFVDSSNGTVVGTYGAIFRTTDGGMTWLSQSSGTTNDLQGVSYATPTIGSAVGNLGTILRSN
jgi:photosystem II stability/assembly factor-like uncharacterized protein